MIPMSMTITINYQAGASYCVMKRRKKKYMLLKAISMQELNG